MRRVMKYNILSMVLVLSPFLLGMDDGGQGHVARTTLQESQQAMHAKVVLLKREQDFLLFQKVMYAEDSKYLILNITEKTGQLKYKNRVLKDFRFTLLKKAPRNMLQPGRLVLTKKAAEDKDRPALIFGTSLIVQWKRVAVIQREANVSTISLPEKEMRSVFFAVEEGAMAYIVL